MTALFADTFYWVALADFADSAQSQSPPHRKALPQSSLPLTTFARAVRFPLSAYFQSDEIVRSSIREPIQPSRHTGPRRATFACDGMSAGTLAAAPRAVRVTHRTLRREGESSGSEGLLKCTTPFKCTTPPSQRLKRSRTPRCRGLSAGHRRQSRNSAGAAPGNPVSRVPRPAGTGLSPPMCYTLCITACSSNGTRKRTD